MPVPASTRSAFAEPSVALEVRLLGLVDFDAAFALQEWLVYEASGRSDTAGTLILCEHPPLITIGREGSAAQIKADDAELEAAEVPVRWISRGGGAMVHAPGQLAIYPILPLDRLGINVAEYRRRLEVAVQNVSRDARIAAKRIPDMPGLWARGGEVAHFGAAVKSSISTLGMYLNVAPHPSFLKLVRGRDGERITSLQAQLLRRVSMSLVRESAIRHIATAFDYDVTNTFTGHPQLIRSRQSICVHV